MSKLRPTLCKSDEPGLNYEDTFLRVYQAVANKRSLIHGRLEDRGHYCAIGSYFSECSNPIDCLAVDEIAAYNDSFPKLTPKRRWQKVLWWLKRRAAL